MLFLTGCELRAQVKGGGAPRLCALIAAVTYREDGVAERADLSVLADYSESNPMAMLGLWL